MYLFLEFPSVTYTLCPLNIFFVYLLILNFEWLLSIFVPSMRDIHCVASEMVTSKIKHMLPSFLLGKTTNMQQIHIIPIIPVQFSVVL